ncbi:MAG: Conserved rane protein [Microbacteriaceae bacterium]|nr:Conserved rane protein [Microbacteriaceae bacterium]HEV7957759.1 LysM peptidoglycan-binding domain-containing protein [Marisediminicola sp.]
MTMSTTASTRRSNSKPNPNRRLRLTRRGRLVLTSLAALPFVLAVALTVLSGGVANASGDSAGVAAFEYVQVESGQSLWELAEAIAPDADPRDVISDVVHLNQLSSSDVQPGQQLAVPDHYRG